MLTVGMLWYGNDVDEAIKYFEKKHGKIPNLVECPVNFSLLNGKKIKVLDNGMTLVESKSVIKNNLFVGCREDKDFNDLTRS